MGERKSGGRNRELLIHNLIQNRNSNVLPSLSALESRAKNNNNTITDPVVTLVLVLCHFSKASHFQQIRYILFSSVIFCHPVYFPGLSSFMPHRNSKRLLLKGNAEGDGWNTCIIFHPEARKKKIRYSNLLIIATVNNEFDWDY